MTDSDYTWDRRKAAANRRRHGLVFDVAVEVFADRRAVTFYDALHSEEEDRYIIIGTLANGAVVAVVYAPQESGAVRIISARKATPRERREYGDQARD